MGTGLGGGGVAAGQILIVPQAIPGTLPAADLAPPSLSHPQYSHPLPRHTPQPPSSTSLPAPPTMHSQLRKSSTFASQLCRSFCSSITPLGGPDQKQIPPLLEFTTHPIPHSLAVLPGPGPGCCPPVTLESRATTKGLLAVWLRVSGPKSVQGTPW